LPIRGPRAPGMVGQVRPPFDAGQTERIEGAKRELVARFEDWRVRHDVAADPLVLTLALDFAFQQYADARHWRVPDIRALLTEWLPKEAPLVAADHGAVPPGLHAIVDFFDSEDMLDATSATPAALHEAIDEQQPAFQAGMSDERNFGLGKLWVMRMLADGVDLGDTAAVDTFMRTVSTEGLDVDERVLGDITERHLAEAAADASPAWVPQEATDLPPVRLPSEAELATAAESSVLVARLRAFARWVGEGRRLGPSGTLTVADARELAESLDLDRDLSATARRGADLPEVSSLAAWARAAGVVREHGGSLVAGPASASRLPALRLWMRAFDSVDTVTAALLGSDEPGSLFGEFLPELLPVLYLPLYTAGGDPVRIAALRNSVRDTIVEHYGWQGPATISPQQQRAWCRDVDATLAALRLLGALRYDTDSTGGGLVALTGIGLWAVDRLLRTEGPLG
ncbi:MAG: hypothetical protein ACRDRL_20040, partial [Sciscionella sp.]